jgi:hypothetical protein
MSGRSGIVRVLSVLTVCGLTLGGGPTVTAQQPAGSAWDAPGERTRSRITSDGPREERQNLPDANTTRVYKRIDNRTYEYVQSVGGKVTTTSRTVVAADGKTRTITTTGKNAQGQTVNNVAFYDRQ